MYDFLGITTEEEEKSGPAASGTSSTPATPPAGRARAPRPQFQPDVR